jgi:hypothetical protein
METGCNLGEKIALPEAYQHEIQKGREKMRKTH